MKQQILQLILTKLSYDNLLAQEQVEEAFKQDKSSKEIVDDVTYALNRLVATEAALARFNAMLAPNNTTVNQTPNGDTQQT